jgi:hypothetical protein
VELLVRFSVHQRPHRIKLPSELMRRVTLMCAEVMEAWLHPPKHGPLSGLHLPHPHLHIPHPHLHIPHPHLHIPHLHIPHPHLHIPHFRQGPSAGSAPHEGKGKGKGEGEGEGEKEQAAAAIAAEPEPASKPAKFSFRFRRGKAKRGGGKTSPPASAASEAGEAGQAGEAGEAGEVAHGAGVRAPPSKELPGEAWQGDGHQLHHLPAGAAPGAPAHLPKQDFRATLTVKRAGREELRLPVQEGDLLLWAFTLPEADLFVAVAFEFAPHAPGAEPDTKEVQPRTEYSAKEDCAGGKMVGGSHLATEDGVVVVSFDNRHSRLKPRRVDYHIVCTAQPGRRRAVKPARILRAERKRQRRLGRTVQAERRAASKARAEAVEHTGGGDGALGVPGGGKGSWKRKGKAEEKEEKALNKHLDLFFQFDGDGDGELQAFETSMLLHEMHLPLTDAQLDAAVELMDATRCGRVNAAAFARWWAAEGRELERHSGYGRRHPVAAVLDHVHQSLKPARRALLARLVHLVLYGEQGVAPADATAGWLLALLQRKPLLMAPKHFDPAADDSDSDEEEKLIRQKSAARAEAAVRGAVHAAR